MSQPDPIQTNIRIDPVEDGYWHAHEPASDRDLKGRGETPPEAVRNYCWVVEARDTSEVPADD
jgi:hypothetical protein